MPARSFDGSLVIALGFRLAGALFCVACGADDELEPCDLVKESSVPATGALSIRYAGRQGRAPEHFQTFVRLATDNGPNIQGCAGPIDDSGAWLFWFAWGALPAPGGFPVEIRFDDDTLPHFVGRLARCGDTCAETDLVDVFNNRIVGGATTRGSGTVGEYDASIGKLVSHIEVTNGANELTVIDADLAWPPKLQ
jgi:hypothetical protein